MAEGPSTPKPEIGFRRDADRVQSKVDIRPEEMHAFLFSEPGKEEGRIEHPLTQGTGTKKTLEIGIAVFAWQGLHPPSAHILKPSQSSSPSMPMRTTLRKMGNVAPPSPGQKIGSGDILPGAPFQGSTQEE